MHLTNFCLNKEHENYINPQEYGEDNHGSKRLLTKFFEQLKKDSDFDDENAKYQIISTIKKTIICLVPYLKNFAKKAMETDIKKIKCFQIIGFDIMMDQNCKAYLMEINSNPSMNMFLERQNEKGENEKEISELDKYLKTLVIEDALKIIRSKKQLDDLG
jgi:tubulin polyglutamylase TTLL11